MNAIAPISYEAALKARYAAVRANLYAAPKPRLLVVQKQSEAPAVEQEAVVAEVVSIPLPPPAKSDILDMYAAPGWRFLLRLASLRHQIPAKDILSDKRSREIVAARSEAMAMVYQHTQLSTTIVGKMFNRDHTTVLHALVKFDAKQKLVEMRPLTKPSRAKPKQKPENVIEEAPKRREKTPTALQKAVIRAYKNNVDLSVFAEAYGCNPRSVAVIAHRLGLKRSDFSAKAGQ